MTQEVFASLFADDAKALRAWDPARGMSLVNFVGLIAEHQVANIFRSGKRRPWSEDMAVDHDFETTIGEDERGPERTFASMQSFTLLLDRMRAELTPRGFELFKMMFIDEASVEAVCARTGMSTDAVYAWRSRLPKIVRKIAAIIEAENASQPRLAASGAAP